MSIKRNFAVGEECVYFKFYMRSFFADIILIKLSKLIFQKMQGGAVKHWFFIRYTEPDFHIRVRLFISDVSKISSIITDVNELLKEEIKTKITTLVLDNYVREIERYDPLCMEIMEELFFHDTVLLIQFLELLEEGQFSEDDRWIYGLISIDKTLSDFQFNLNEKLVFVRSINLLFSKEFQKDKNLNKQLDAAFRDNEKIINNNLSQTTELSNLFNKRSEKIQILTDEIINLNQKKLLTQNFQNILSSYVHMNCNRLFRIQPRKQEFIMYDFLTRFYTKQLYRNR